MKRTTAKHTAGQADAPSGSGLRRSLTLPTLVLYGLGNILGAGIYVLVGKVAGEAGANTVLAFLVAMFIAALTALSYMELSSRFPQSASVSVYLHSAFGRRWLSVGIGIALVFGGVASAAALSKGFAGYLSSIVDIPELLAAVGLLVLLGLVAVKGIKESARLAVAVTLIEVVGLIMVIAFGWDDILLSDVSAMLTVDAAAGAGWAAVLTGAFLAFYAFIGFEDMVNVVEEVREPRRTMPLAIILSLAAATVLYLLVVIVCITVASPDELAASTAPLNLVFERISPLDPRLISLIGLAATVNGVLVQIVMGSRILYGLSRQGWLPGRLADVHERYQTPALATLLVVAAMAVGVILLSLVSLAAVTSFLVLGVFVLVNVSLLVIKLRQRDERAAISVPLFVPAVAAVCCLGLLVFQFMA